MKRKTRGFKSLGAFLLAIVILLAVFDNSIIYSANFAGNEPIKTLEAKVRSHPEDSDARLELAGKYFELAGFTGYYQAQSWLWTETASRKALLKAELPAVRPDAAQNCRKQLLQLLDENSATQGQDSRALILAGFYHEYFNQNEIALWYYQRAVEKAPDSTGALLALADFYLAQWQPAKVIDLLSGAQGPEAALRQGAAWLQMGEYPLALGCLLQAEPLPPERMTTRNLNLLKAGLALGDNVPVTGLQAAGLPDNALPTGLPAKIPATLFQELRGWRAFYQGDLKDAQGLWNDGEKINSRY